MIRTLAVAAGLCLAAQSSLALTAYDSLSGGMGSGIAIGGSANYSSAVVFTSAESGMVDMVTAEFFALDPMTYISASLFDAKTGQMLDSVGLTTPDDQDNEAAIVFSDWEAMLEEGMDYYLMIRGEGGMQIAWSQSPETTVGAFVEDIRFRDGTELMRSTTNYGFNVALSDAVMMEPDPKPDPDPQDLTAVPLPAGALLLATGLLALGSLRGRSS